MKHTIEMLEARIRILEQRDEVINRHIINKLKREIRKLESS